MIYGIGTDICDVRRIRVRGVRYLATRFSAKEAFSKAIGLGMRMPMTWRDCEVVNLASGQPAIVLHGALAEWFDARGLRCHLSVTDESEYAASFCVVERLPGAPGPAGFA